MALKKLLWRLVNNKITAYANKFPKAAIPILFIFSKIVHPCLLLHFLCNQYPLLLFCEVVFIYASNWPQFPLLEF